MEEIDVSSSSSGWLHEWKSLPIGQRRGLQRYIAYVAVLVLLSIKPLVALGIYVSGEDLHSHILLVPFVSLYLLWIRRQSLPARYKASPWVALVFFTAGLAAIGMDWWRQSSPMPWNEGDHWSLFSLGLVCLMVGGGFLFLGGRWMAAAAFPMLLLFFMVPLPDGLAEMLEKASQAATAEAVTGFFHLTGMPFVRDGVDFQLPNIKIEIARECSGIRSSWVLFITSLVASNLFLATNKRRALLAFIVIPLGVLRNGFRVALIGWLCVEIGPEMIDSYIHHHGGPIFFALSLIPLFLLLFWLQRSEMRQARRRKDPPAIGQGP